jgi:hypothetical protein
MRVGTGWRAVRVFVSGAVMLFVAATAADEQPFATDRDYVDWVNFYYTAPDPQRIISAFLYYADSSVFKKDKSSRIPMAHFYAELLRREPFRSRQLYDVLLARGSDKARMLSLHVFWLTGDDTGRELMGAAGKVWTGRHFQNFLRRYGPATPRRALDEPVDAPATLDVLWSIFFATGDEQAVLKIIDVARRGEDGVGAEVLLGGTAEWSLINNAQQHLRVRRIVAREIVASRGARREVLKRVLDRSG